MKAANFRQNHMNVNWMDVIKQVVIGMKYSLFNYSSSGDSVITNWLLSLRNISKYSITRDTKMGKNKLEFFSP